MSALSTETLPQPNSKIGLLPQIIQDLVILNAWGPYYETYCVTDGRSRAHVEASGDDNPVHLSDEAAREFLPTLSGRIAHGDHLISMLPDLLRPLFRSFFEANIRLIYLGGGPFRFVRTIPIGGSIKAQVKILQPSENARGVLLKYDYRILDAALEEIAVTGSKHLLCMF
ncbi:MAG: MaoC family dehydratase [Patescibacteria group bacterium]|nr:MaoC family dehydratase [Patescibacteria group bacterium]